MVFPLDNKVRRYNLAIHIYSLDHYNPFPIARLLRTRPAAAFGACHNLCGREYAYYKPSLVEIVDVPLLDRVLVNYISYEPKLRVYYVGIFAFGPLVIDSTLKTRCKLGVLCYEAIRLSGSDARRVAGCTKAISYFSNVREPGRKPSRVKVEYPLEKDFFF